jgi:DNA-binding transcriptional MocR family regulator
MRKIDRILREILHRFYQGGERFFNQKGLAKICALSLGTVNPLIARLEGLGAIERKPLGFRLVDPKRALLYWAITRELEKDITYTTFVPGTVEELEARLPRGAILTAYSGFRAKLDLTPADYEQVFVYADHDEIKHVFKPTSRQERNLFVLTPDGHLQRRSEKNVAPLVQIYVDLWQLGAPANRFVEELEREFAPAPTRALEGVTKTFEKERREKR